MSKPKLFILLDGRKLPLKLPREDAAFALVPGLVCPHCGDGNVGVQGTGKRPSEDDRAWEADGVSTCCERPLGTIRAEVDTLFGVREDRAVLEGRCRVYA